MSLAIGGLNTNTYFGEASTGANTFNTFNTSNTSNMFNMSNTSSNIFAASQQSEESLLLRGIDNFLRDVVEPTLAEAQRESDSALGDSFLRLIDGPLPSFDMSSFVSNYGPGSTPSVLGANDADGLLLSSIDNFINNTVRPTLAEAQRESDSALGDSFLRLIDGPLTSFDMSSFINSYGYY